MNTPSVKQVTRAFNLGLKVVANMLVLNEEEIAHYEANLDQIPGAVKRGFIIPQKKSLPTPPEVITLRNTDWWIAKTEEFSEKHLGVKINLRDRFVIPAELPWDSVIPVFDPGNLTNCDAVKKALKGLKLDVYEEVDVMKYAGSEASKEPTLHFIENSVRPNKDSMNLSPNDLRATGKNYLRLRGYALVMAVYHFATGEYLDHETFTWFPEDRLPDGRVADGYWDMSGSTVRFDWCNPDFRSSYGGARVAMPVSLKP